MNKLFLIILLVFQICFSFSCQQPGEVAEETILDESKKSEIAETITELAKEAFDAGTRNLDEMFSYFSDNTKTIEIGNIDYSWEEHKKNTKAFMANIADYKYTWDGVEVDVLSEDAAIIYGYYSYTMKDTADNIYEGKIAWTWVFAKEGGDWKIRHTHISAPIQAN